VTSSFFGRVIVQANSPRQVQFGLKVMWQTQILLEQEFLIEQAGDVRQEPNQFVVWHEESA